MTTYTIDGKSSKAKDREIKSGDSLIANSGGVAERITISGGTAVANSGSSYSDTVLNSGTLTVNGGALTDTTITGGKMTMSSGTISGSIYASGGTAIIGSGGHVSIDANIPFIISNKADVTIRNTDPVSIGLRSGGTLRTNIAELNKLTIFADQSGYKLDIVDLDPDTITGVDYGDYQIVIHTTTRDVLINGNLPGYALSSDGRGGTILTVCFAEGTHISTPNGEREIETLAVGDLVVTDHGPKPVLWIGRKHVELHGHMPNEAHLVCVRKDAFATEEPCRDLYITPEHCVHVEGALTPVRMLINGGSIHYAHNVRSFTYYHIDVGQHALLLAENLKTESFFAGSNVRLFDTPYDLPIRQEARSDYPLAVSRSHVEPIWHRLAERSDLIGYPVDHPEYEDMNPSAVTVTTATGRELVKVAQHAGRATFLALSNVNCIRITSNARRPDEVIGPFVDDRRELGVRVGHIRLIDQDSVTVLSDHLRDATLGGWNGVENHESRWTKHAGLVPIPQLPGALRSIQIEIELPDQQ